MKLHSFIQRLFRPISIAFYSFGIRAYGLVVWVASFWNKKARQWIAGRNEELRMKNEEWGRDGHWVWIHCASVGEFEQGRPLMEIIRAEKPDWKIMLTFFSPSGFELRKNTPLADAIIYMPLDTEGNAKAFLEALKPQMAIFIKYEFWYHHLAALHQRHIPIYLVSARFRKEQPFFRFYGGLFREMLGYFEQLFVQDEHSKQLLNEIGIENVSVCGDTRADRVASLASKPFSNPLVEEFANDASVLVCGSTWPADEVLLMSLIQKKLILNGWKAIIAPHEMDEADILALEKALGQCCARYSQTSLQEAASAKVLILDTIGMLSEVYRYGRLAYIGGGFGKGIHNVLEPAAYGLPVIFGPKHQKFREAIDLLEMGGAQAIQDEVGLFNAFAAWEDLGEYAKASKAAKGYVAAQEGATRLIFNKIISPHNDGGASE